MADMENEEDLFADLYDGEADDSVPVAATTVVKSDPDPVPETVDAKSQHDSIAPGAAQPDDFNIKPTFDEPQYGGAAGAMQGVDMQHGMGQNGGGGGHAEGGRRQYDDLGDRPIHIKDDGAEGWSGFGALNFNAEPLELGHRETPLGTLLIKSDTTTRVAKRTAAAAWKLWHASQRIVQPDNLASLLKSARQAPATLDIPACRNLKAQKAVQ
ncbi:hypothetical protein LTR53_001319 [Teratosphaeriaceae sp. CCFEE 6253]|nr:hypothetical protein LTR53_001319 [Teratosphaeriaceae sp. CCFEE 6253]